MSLNPIAFGEHVVEQFQRYLLTYFPIADQRMEAQVRAHLTRGPGGRRELVRGPYIHLSRPFEPGPPGSARRRSANRDGIAWTRCRRGWSRRTQPGAGDARARECHLTRGARQALTAAHSARIASTSRTACSASA